MLTDNASNMIRAFKLHLPEWENDSRDLVVEHESATENFVEFQLDIEMIIDGKVNEYISLFDDQETEDEATTQEIQDAYQLVLTEVDHVFSAGNNLNLTAPLRTGCTAHTLQLVVKGGLNTLSVIYMFVT